MSDSPKRLTYTRRTSAASRRTSAASVTRTRESGPAVDRVRRVHQSGFVELVRQLQRELGQLPRELGHQVTRRLPSA